MESELLLANLDDDQIEKIQGLERDLADACVIAYEKPAAGLTISAGLPIANLSAQQIDSLKALEIDLTDVCLLAFDAL